MGRRITVRSGEIYQSATKRSRRKRAHVRDAGQRFDVILSNISEGRGGRDIIFIGMGVDKM